MSETNGGRSTDAGFCRANGWVAGDILEREEDGWRSRIRLTAIGEDYVLARIIARRRPEEDWWTESREGEADWPMRRFNWKKVDPVAPGIAGG